MDMAIMKRKNRVRNKLKIKKGRKRFKRKMIYLRLRYREI